MSAERMATSRRVGSSQRVWLVACALAAGSCGSSAGDLPEVCSLDLALDPAAAEPGVVVTATGGPLTDEGIRDTLVLVGGVPAEVTAVVRSDECTNDIDGCDVCRVEANCPPCGFCPTDVLAAQALGSERMAQCFGDPVADPPVEGLCDLCTETLTFVVPALPPGPAPVIVFNGNGQSPTLLLDVLATPTTTKTPTGTTATP